MAEHTKDLSGRDQEDLAVGRAIQRAAGSLPHGWEIHIYLERDAGSVYVIAPDGGSRGVDDGESFSDQINAAISAALASPQVQK